MRERTPWRYRKDKLRLYVAVVPYLVCRIFIPETHHKNQGKTRVLVFHHLDRPDVFDKALHAIRRHYQVISFNQYLCGDKARSKLNVILAFDDGFRSCFEHGRPIFRKHGVSPLLFINSDFVGLDREAAHRYCRDAMMISPEASLSWEDVKTLAADGAEIGGHALGHADLSAMAEESAIMDRIAPDRAAIQNALEHAIRCFAYPFGRHSRLAAHCAEKAGYKYAFSSDSGFLEDSPSPFLLNRTNVGVRPPLVVLAMIEGWGDWISKTVQTVKKRRHAA
jgi:peptidoglycan/xylan/chitin deacetylase (PgdA/CDA1 family)